MVIMTSSFSKSFVFPMFFCPPLNTRSAFSSSSGLKSVFKKLRFRDSLLPRSSLSSSRMEKDCVTLVTHGGRLRDPRHAWEDCVTLVTHGKIA